MFKQVFNEAAEAIEEAGILEYGEVSNILAGSITVGAIVNEAMCSAQPIAVQRFAREPDDDASEPEHVYSITGVAMHPAGGMQLTLTAQHAASRDMGLKITIRV